MPTAEARELESRRLERGLIRVRWFGVFLGIYLVSETNAGAPPHASNAEIAFAYSLIGLLAVGNVVIGLILRRTTSMHALGRLGLAAFLLDAVVLFGISWAYSYDPRGSQWVVTYILPLEGALRYRLRGAMAAVAMSLVNELAREVYLSGRFTAPDLPQFIPPYPFLISNVAYRVGLLAIIAAVAGFMSRSLARQRDKADETAARFEEVARRESAARAELAAFNTAILTGVAAEDLDQSLRLMAAAIGRDLGFESFSILLLEGDELKVKGMFGMPFYDRGIPIGRGVTGTVAATGKPLVVPDVLRFPDYIEADPEMRSELAVPMRIGDELIGVVDVEDREADAFDEGSVGLLTRLADQIALVAHSNRLLSQQRETMRRLQELDQMKLDFVAITSHELRTPITAIRGFVKTLLRNRDRLTSDQVQNFMNIIDRQSSRLARLVDDLLFVSRIEAGRIRLQMEQVDLGELLREGVEALGQEGRGGRIRLSVEPAHSEVVVDPQRLHQIVRNLIENALKFSDPSDQVDVEGHVAAEQVEIAVTDHGIGIAAEELPHIFDRFHQAGQVLTRETEGAGLGLYITKRLVEAMGGSISVISEPGQGSTFRITLPNRPASEVGTRAGRAGAGTWVPNRGGVPPVGSTLVEGSA